MNESPVLREGVGWGGCGKGRERSVAGTQTLTYITCHKCSQQACDERWQVNRPTLGLSSRLEEMEEDNDEVRED